MSHTLIDFQEHIDPASTAEWRWEKAAEFPGDARNEKAAKELERIAGEFELLKGSEIHQQIDEACHKFLSNPVRQKAYQPFGDLRFKFPGHDGATEDRGL